MNEPMMHGWICPKCSRVYAPHVVECTTCNQEHVVRAEASSPDPATNIIPDDKLQEILDYIRSKRVWDQDRFWQPYIPYRDDNTDSTGWQMPKPPYKITCVPPSTPITLAVSNDNR